MDATVPTRSEPRGSCILWLAAGAAAAVPWAFQVAGWPWHRRLAQLVVAAGLVALAALGSRGAARAFRAELARSRPLAWALLALVALSFVVHFAGLSFEVGRGYYKDEGIYRSAAQRILDGDALPRSFVYGHLPFYLAAWSVWLRQLFVAPTTWLIATFSSLEPDGELTWMMLRGWSGFFGALTVLPVIGVARRILDFGAEGDDFGPGQATATFGGLLAGALIVASDLYNEVTHLYISDVPAAFFAALALGLTARLLERETIRDYLWAGVACGLAAGSKYPAGLVAVAVLAVWLLWRWRERRWGSGIVLAGAAAIATFVAVMPSIVVHTERAFGGGRGRNLFFGLRQYGGAGWIGVVKESNLEWYLERLLETFGVAALLGGLIGLFALERRSRRHWLTMAAFPLLYLALLLTMNVAVVRNLLPLLPAVAALLGAGAAGAASRLARAPILRTRNPLLAPAAVAVVVLASPSVGISEQTIGYSSPGTRELTARWIYEHLPPGAGVVKEAYTPDFGGPYDIHQTRFAPRVDPELLWGGRFEFVLLAASGYSRFLDSEEEEPDSRSDQVERYRALLALPEVFAIEGSATRIGPGFTLRRLERPGAAAVERRTFAAGDAVLSHWKLRTPEGDLAFNPDGDFAAFKERFAPGRYALNLDGDAIASGRVEVYSIDGALLAAMAVGRDPLRFELRAPGKIFFKVALNPGARLRGLTIEPEPAPAGP